MRRDEVHVWWVDLDELALPSAPERMLAPDELDHAARLRRPTDAARFRGARAATRVILGEATGLPPAALTFDRACERCGGPHGKPRLAPRHEVRFNASRAGRMLVLAVALGREVGVDVEARERARDVAAVAQVAFAPAEKARLANLPDPEQVDAFLDMWTCKEAYLKLVGVGLAAPLQEVDTSAWRDDEVLYGPLGPAGSAFSLRRFRAGPEHVGSVAMANPPVEVRVERWRP